MTNSQIERGHEEPFGRQFSVFLPNRVGQLHELLRLLNENHVEMLGLSLSDSADWAVARMVFSQPDKAREVLLRNEMAFTDCEVLLVVLTAPQTISQVTQLLLATELNLHFAFPLMFQHEGHPVLALRVDEHDVAIQALTEHKFTLLGHEDA